MDGLSPPVVERTIVSSPPETDQPLYLAGDMLREADCLVDKNRIAGLKARNVQKPCVFLLRGSQVVAGEGIFQADVHPSVGDGGGCTGQRALSADF